MAGVSAAHLIMFIASVIVAASVAGVLMTEVEKINQALTDRGGQITEEIRTDISVINDPRAVAFETSGDGEYGNITLLVQNTGAETLSFDPREAVVLINGELITNENLSVRPADTATGPSWQPGDVACITVSSSEIQPNSDIRATVSVRESTDTVDFRTGPGGGNNKFVSAVTTPGGC